MKLSEESKLGRKLEEWFVDENSSHSVYKNVERRFCERVKRYFNTEKKIENKIKKWLTREEKEDSDSPPAYIIEGSLFKKRKILMTTSRRAVLFEYSFSGVLEDKSDKIWRQLVSVHLQEKLSHASLKLHFFEFHDSIFYHNPNQFSQEPRIVSWILADLDKDQARDFYILLKEKEISMKEMRRQEHIDNKIIGVMKPPGGGK